MLTLIIGGARSGKSRVAQSLCSAAGRVSYIATARDEDAEMRARIERHRLDRPPHWTTLEEPLALAAAVRSALPSSDVILVDCLTLWLSNFMRERQGLSAVELEAAATAEIEQIACLAAERAVILVSNETGGGIVPDHPVGRLFRDLQGLVNQAAAARADRVFLTVAGIPVRIKPSPENSILC